MIGKCCEMNMRRCMQPVSKIFTILDKGMTGKQVIRYAKRFVAACMPIAFIAWWRKIYDRCFYTKKTTTRAIWKADVRHIDMENIHKWSVVYAAWVWGNMTFEEQLAKEHDCDVYVFDPSPQGQQTASKPQNIHERIHFFPWWIAGQDGESVFDAPNEETGGCYVISAHDEQWWSHNSHDARDGSNASERFVCRSISSLVRENGHTKIDLLKMDIEWFEYEVLEDVFAHWLDVKQICLEFHDFFDHIPYAKTARAQKLLRDNWYVCIYRHMKDYTFLRMYDRPKISVITISRHHLFEMAKALSKIHRLYQFFSCFPGAVTYGIRAAKNIFYPTINYYFVQVCALLPVVSKKKNRYTWQTKRFGEEVKKDYKPTDILITNVWSADALLQDIKKQWTRIIIEQWSTCMRKQAALMQEEYARRWKTYKMPSQAAFDHNEHIFELADLITIPSLRVRRSFEEYNFHTNKLFQNKYGVKTEIFYDRGWRRQDKFILINAWSQELRKWTLYSLQAWQKLWLKNAEFRVIGTILPDLQDLIKPYTSDPTIKYMRSQSQDMLAKLFSQASCFLITSLEEWLATTPMQGMACWLPLISNINSWGEDCVIEWHNGRMAKTRDVDDIAEKIQRMYDHRDECRAMWDHAAAYIQKEHSRDGYAQRAYEKYLALL